MSVRIKWRLTVFTICCMYNFILAVSGCAQSDPNLYSSSTLDLGTTLQEFQWSRMETLGGTREVKENNLSAIFSFSSKTESFHLIALGKKVVEYSYERKTEVKQISQSYLDKLLWLNYVHESIAIIPDSMKLSEKEPVEVLRAYYSVLGLNDGSYYGWTCEYSTVGSLTPQRSGLMELINKGRHDLVSRLIHYPNIEVKMYAFEALIYFDFDAKKRIERLNEKAQQYKFEMDTLESVQKVESYRYRNLKMYISDIERGVRRVEDMFLTKRQKTLMTELSNSDSKVAVCHNGGSYNLYDVSIGDIWNLDIETIIRNFNTAGLR